MSATKVTSRSEIAVWTAAQAAQFHLALLYNADATEAWAYNADATDATRDGFVIVPADTPASGRWIRQSDYVATALALNDVANAPAKAVEPGSISTDHLAPDVIEELARATENVNSIHKQLVASLQHVMDVAASAGANVQSLKRSLTVQTGALQADYQERITVVTTNLEALAQLYEEVSASLAGKVDTSAFLALQSSVSTITGVVSAHSEAILSVQASLGNKVETSAFSALQTTVTEQGGMISAQATSLTGIYAQVGDLWAQALIRSAVTVTPAGFDSYVQVSATGSSGGPAAMFIGVKTVGGVPLAYIDWFADRMRWLTSAGVPLALLTSAGFIVGDRVFPGTVSNGENYSLVGGTLALGAQDTTAAPSDGSETSISSGHSTFAYDDSKSDTISVGGFTADPAAQIFDVEGFFYFRVQTGGPSTIKACIEYYDGSWHTLPGSTAVIFTSNTDTLATLTPKGSIPYGATYWRPRLFNTTGNYIHVREARGLVSNFSK